MPTLLESLGYTRAKDGSFTARSRSQDLDDRRNKNYVKANGGVMQTVYATAIFRDGESIVLKLGDNQFPITQKGDLLHCGKLKLKDQNLWQSSDWCCYNRGKHHGDFGIPQQCQNPFYLLGYAKGYEKYQQH